MAVTKIPQDQIVQLPETNWTTPSFQNGWVNYSVPSHESAGYRRDANGNVYLRGLIMSGTLAVAAFTLPAGFRPGGTHPNPKKIFCVLSNGVVGRIDLFPDGTVVPLAPSSTAWVSLDGIVFKAEQ